jgi:hypothetical protein
MKHALKSDLKMRSRFQLDSHHEETDRITELEGDGGIILK